MSPAAIWAWRVTCAAGFALAVVLALIAGSWFYVCLFAALGLSTDMIFRRIRA